MPLISLEITPDLIENDEIPEILSRLVDTVSQQESVDSKAVRAGHSMVRLWAMGSGAPRGFAHCQVAILAGRPIELQQRIANAVMETMKECFHRSLQASAVNVSLELREMQPATYLKTS